MTDIDIHESQQAQLRRTTIAVFALAALFVILRFIARLKKGLRIGVDDYTIVVALAFLFEDGGFNLALIHYGMGLHAQILPPENLMMIGKVRPSIDPLTRTISFHFHLI
ncbi:hypothetical protein VTN77DRAFT_4078 [Rasamsonia byssochlamydoides]|uniref:uncharacterized protein n=1 Tax=Rasamsonia byssochlamydoides TaxID=89139 RepID=UPI0037443BB0